jgi:hypothetical protein
VPSLAESPVGHGAKTASDGTGGTFAKVQLFVYSSRQRADLT